MEVNKEELRRLAEAATPGPWRECGADRGGCACGQIWSIYSDCPVAEVWQGDDVIGEPDQGAMANAAFIAKANPSAILSLLDDLSQATLQCAKHGKALQEIGAALSLSAGSDLHKQCVPEIYRLFQSIGSDVTEAYKERMACQEVIDQLRAENERLRKDAERWNWYAPKVAGLVGDALEAMNRHVDLAMTEEGRSNS